MPVFPEKIGAMAISAKNREEQGGTGRKQGAAAAAPRAVR
jgi:hypothetical protein